MHIQVNQLHSSEPGTFKWTGYIQVNQLHSSEPVSFKWTSYIQVNQLHSSEPVTFKWTRYIQVNRLHSTEPRYIQVNQLHSSEPVTFKWTRCIQVNQLHSSEPLETASKSKSLSKSIVRTVWTTTRALGFSEWVKDAAQSMPITDKCLHAATHAFWINSSQLHLLSGNTCCT